MEQEFQAEFPLNPNNTVARYNSDYPYHKNVDRMDLVKSCPPICFSSMGIYEVISQGEILAPVTRGMNVQETSTATGGTSEVRMPVARRQVRTLVNGVQPAGEHSAGFDLRDEGGRVLAPGLYLVRLETAAGALTRRLVSVR